MRSRIGLAWTLEQLALLAIVTMSDPEPGKEGKEAKDPAKVAERQTAIGNAVSYLRQAQSSMMHRRSCATWRRRWSCRATVPKPKSWFYRRYKAVAK